ncbi:Protein_disulfide isomerase PDI2 [Hexamita inflata]|uniref:protein disulfide-isomerase n=1 Tax=Hexamita inflata TaxID=28002 RepID=A0AA86TWH5_9EUKA|nr:Protein disulfide isomerase PDI2 [Hexamita inflata]
MLCFIGLLSIEMDRDNFEEYPKKFVKFFAPWCGHCKELKPIWDELTQQYWDIPLGEVNCDEEPKLCKPYATSYPTLVLFDGNNSIVYDGKRELDKMLDFLEKKVVPVFEFEDEDDVHDNNRQRNVQEYFILYTNDVNDKVTEWSKQLQHIHLVKDKVRKLVAFRDRSEIEFDQEFKKQQVVDFIKANQVPFFVELKKENKRRVEKRNNTVVVVDTFEHKTLLQNMQDKVQEMKGGEWQSYYQIIYMDVDQWTSLVESFTPHTKKDAPFLLIYNPQDPDNYYDRKIENEENIADETYQFMQDVMGGKEWPKYKGEWKKDESKKEL